MRLFQTFNKNAICAVVFACSFLMVQPVMSEPIVEAQKTLDLISPEIGSTYLRLRVDGYSADIQKGATADEGILRIKKTDGWETVHLFELNGGRLPEPRDIDIVIHCGAPQVLVTTQTLYADASVPVFIYERHLLDRETGAMLRSVDDTLSFEARGVLPAAAVVSALFPECTP